MYAGGVAEIEPNMWDLSELSYYDILALGIAFFSACQNCYRQVILTDFHHPYETGNNCITISYVVAVHVF